MSADDSAGLFIKILLVILVHLRLSAGLLGGAESACIGDDLTIDCAFVSPDDFVIRVRAVQLVVTGIHSQLCFHSQEMICQVYALPDLVTPHEAAGWFRDYAEYTCYGHRQCRLPLIDLYIDQCEPGGIGKLADQFIIHYECLFGLEPYPETATLPPPPIIPTTTTQSTTHTTTAHTTTAHKTPDTTTVYTTIADTTTAHTMSDTTTAHSTTAHITSDTTTVHTTTSLNRATTRTFSTTLPARATSVSTMGDSKVMTSDTTTTPTQTMPTSNILYVTTPTSSIPTTANAKLSPTTSTLSISSQMTSLVDASTSINRNTTSSQAIFGTLKSSGARPSKSTSSHIPTYTESYTATKSTATYAATTSLPSTLSIPQNETTSSVSMGSMMTGSGQITTSDTQRQLHSTTAQTSTNRDNTKNTNSLDTTSMTNGDYYTSSRNLPTSTDHAFTEQIPSATTSTITENGTTSLSTADVSSRYNTATYNYHNSTSTKPITVGRTDDMNPTATFTATKSSLITSVMASATSYSTGLNHFLTKTYTQTTSMQGTQKQSTERLGASTQEERTASEQYTNSILISTLAMKEMTSTAQASHQNQYSTTENRDWSLDTKPSDKTTISTSLSGLQLLTTLIAAHLPTQPNNKTTVADSSSFPRAPLTQTTQDESQTTGSSSTAFTAYPTVGSQNHLTTDALVSTSATAVQSGLTLGQILLGFETSPVEADKTSSGSEAPSYTITYNLDNVSASVTPNTSHSYVTHANTSKPADGVGPDARVSITQHGSSHNNTATMPTTQEGRGLGPLETTILPDVRPTTKEASLSLQVDARSKSLENYIPTVVISLVVSILITGGLIYLFIKYKRKIQSTVRSEECNMTGVEQISQSSDADTRPHKSLWNPIKERIFGKSMSEKISSSSLHSSSKLKLGGEIESPDGCKDMDPFEAVYSREVRLDDGAAFCAFKGLVGRSPLVEGWGDLEETRRASSLCEDPAIFEDFANSFITCTRRHSSHMATLTDLEDTPSPDALTFTNLENTQEEYSIGEIYGKDDYTVQTLVKYVPENQHKDMRARQEDNNPGSPLRPIPGGCPNTTISKIYSSTTT